MSDVLDRVDLAYSRFRPDSELVAVNAAAEADAAAARSSPSRSPWRCGPPNRRTARSTRRSAGRCGRSATTTTSPNSRRGRVRSSYGWSRSPGWQTVELSHVRQEVVLRRGVELDLGSTGKALAADLAAGAAIGAIGPMGGVLVSLGGDIATAGSAPDGGWRILVAEDSETPVDGDGETIAIPRGAIATSSTTVRRWQRGTVALHHLIDPRTGGPVESPWRTVTVAAPTCVEANTAATAAIVLGSRGLDSLAASGRPARLVGVEGGVVRVNGWPEPIPA